MPTLLRRHLLVWPLPLLAIGLAQCSDGGTSPTVPECSGDVVLQVGAGTTPRFSWAPACALLGLDLIDSTTGSAVWSVVSSTANNSIAPPVVFGTVPTHATEDLPSVPLVAGHRYQIALTRLDRSDPAVPVAYTAATVRFAQ